MWIYGYTDPFGGDGPVDVCYGECTGFVEALSALYDSVEKEAVEAETYQCEHFEQILFAIRRKMNDPDIKKNPDKQPDTVFTDDLAEIEYFVSFVA